LTSVEYEGRKARRSRSTAVTYAGALRLWAKCLNFGSPDQAAAEIKAGRLDVYKALDDFVGYCMQERMAPKTTLTYLGAVKGFLRHEDITIDQYRLREKVTLPPKVEVSLDRTPTQMEIRKLLLEADLRMKAAIAVLTSSGMRIGELCGLRIGNIIFDKTPPRIRIPAKNTKTKQARLVRITDETANLLREYLGKRIDDKESWLFPHHEDSTKPYAKNALHNLIMRLNEKCGLLDKLDPESKRYALHPHCLRKYFFTQLIASGIDRGTAEYFIGHKFGLDANYLRLPKRQISSRCRWHHHEWHDYQATLSEL
jgi:integrase